MSKTTRDRFVFHMVFVCCSSSSAFDQFGPDPNAAFRQMEEMEIAQFRCAGVNDSGTHVTAETKIVIDSLIEWHLFTSDGIVRGSASFWDLPSFDPSPFLVFSESKDSLVVDYMDQRFTIRYDEDLKPLVVTAETDEYHVYMTAVEGTLRALSWDYIPGEYGPDKESVFRGVMKVVDHIAIKCR